MKIFISIIAVLLLTVTFFSYKNYNGGKSMAQGVNTNNSKTLVVYFSRTGEQYGVGNITEGNTAIIAKMIAEKTGADIFEIKVKNDNYPTSYNELTKYAQQEKLKNARPEIVGKIENIQEYGRVFVGYPNWWGDMPMPVYTFLESYDLSNTKVYHFCTHEGSGGVKADGLAIYGHVAQNERAEAEKQVENWLKTK